MNNLKFILAVLAILSLTAVTFYLGVIGMRHEYGDAYEEDDGKGYYEPQDSCTHWTSCPQRWEAPK